MLDDDGLSKGKEPFFYEKAFCCFCIPSSSCVICEEDDMELKPRL